MNKKYENYLHNNNMNINSSYWPIYRAHTDEEIKQMSIENEAPQKSHIENIARICHEVNRAYCAAIGDNSQLPWSEAADWQKESAMKGVHYSLNNHNASPSAQHEEWLKEKETTGWKYGPVKDPDKKEHPCFLPYENLPKEQQIKDHLFQAVVNCFR